MGKGSLAKISAALAIISLYVYLFGVMGTVESLDDSIPDDQRQPVQTISTSATPETTPVPVTAAAETTRAVYVYDTQLNVVNAKKPSLADYTATEAMLLVTAESAAALAAPKQTDNDYVMEADDFDYTTPLRTTAAITTTTEETTTTTTTTAVTTTPTTTVPTTTTTVPETLPTTEVITEITPLTLPSLTTVPPETTTTTTTPETTTTTTTTTTAVTTTSETTTTTAATTTTTAETTTLPPETTAEETTEETTVSSAPQVQWGDDVPDLDETERGNEYAGNETLSVFAGGSVVTDDAVTIVAKAVMAEISDGFNEEAIKAQAVATYTYIKYYNDNGSNAYAVLATPTDKVTNCVKEVIGKAIYYNNSMIQAVYCASSAGYTASASNVWGVNYPYLVSRRTDFDELYDINYGRKATFTADEMRSYVLNNTGITLNDDPTSWFEITSRIDGNYVGTMKIGGLSSYTRNGKTVEITGRIMREVIMDFDLRSASFDIAYDPSSATFTFTTYGYGHGCGMSQHGANILATHYGYTYDQILAFYYQGTEVR